MKLIHTADIHLDSRLSRHLDAVRAKERRDELLITFRNMVQYARTQGVRGILICGDLFDVSKISVTAYNGVLSAVEEHPEITFFYLQGNHDADSFVQRLMDQKKTLPPNLKLFSRKWQSYELTDEDGTGVVITGAELEAENNAALAASLTLDESRMNIVMLHGQETETASGQKAEIIPLRDYRNRGIDYLALGHIHSPKTERLDARGIYAYSGCLEGRGFDECGEHGFYLLTVEPGEGRQVLHSEFVPFAYRSLYEIRLDVTQSDSSDAVIRLARKKLPAEGVRREDLVRVLLVGSPEMETELDTGYIKRSLEPDYYYIDCRDKTTPLIHYGDFARDISLKGEFVRLIEAQKAEGKLTEAEAAAIVKTGIGLLMGEEVLK